MSKVRTRFAPSPTGYMHIGNLRTALYEYLIAKHDGGDFILRIEDTDQQREVAGAVDMIYDVLDKTGLHYDEGPDKPGDVGCLLYTSYRVVEKLGLSGFNQLKVQVSLQLDNYSHKDKEVDYNYPFQKHDTHHQIMEKMSSLYDQTIRSTIELIDLKVFLKVIQALYNANHIIIFSSIGNYFMAECFQQNMLELGLRIDVAKERYYQHWYAYSCQKGDVVMLISYAGRTPHMSDIVQILKEKGVTMILISSTIEIPFAKDVDYHLYFSPYEDSEEKIDVYKRQAQMHRYIKIYFEYQMKK